MLSFRALLIGVPLAFFAIAAQAQGTNVAFGAIKADPTLPVEVTADSLDVDQQSGRAEYIGNVVVGQGEMRMSANRLLVVFSDKENAIQRLEATGDVILVSGPDAAEAERAEYTIDSGVIVMTGDVLLTQGQNALTSDSMTVNLTTGTAQMAGRVKTILNTDEQ